MWAGEAGDCEPTEIGFSTFSAISRCLGRDFQPAALGFSTLFGCFPLFG